MFASSLYFCTVHHKLYPQNCTESVQDHRDISHLISSYVYILQCSKLVHQLPLRYNNYNHHYKLICWTRAQALVRTWTDRDEAGLVWCVRKNTLRTGAYRKGIHGGVVWCGTMRGRVTVPPGRGWFSCNCTISSVWMCLFNTATRQPCLKFNLLMSNKAHLLTVFS